MNLLARLHPVAVAALLASLGTAPAARAGLVLYYPFESTRTLGTGTPVTVTYADLVSGVLATSSNSSQTSIGGAGLVGYSTATLYASGQAGNAFEVASYADAVHKGTGSGLTIAFWLRGSTLNANRTLFGEGSTLDSNSYFSLGTDATGTKFRLFFRGQDGVTILDRGSNSTIQNTAETYTSANNKWHHVVWTDSGGAAKLYIDGVQDTANFTYTVPTAAKLANFNTTTILGIRTLSGLVGSAFWGANGGLADDFAVWNVALPQSSVTALYSGLRTPLTVALVEPPPDTAPASLRLTHRAGTTPQVDVDWLDNNLSWTLETSRNLTDWAHVNVASYTNPQAGAFRITENARTNDFYRLRKVGSPNLYVVGDSISTPGAWPINLAPLTSRHTFSQAIGGTTSPSMVARARGVELMSPLTNPVTAATIHMKWSRHRADRTQGDTTGDITFANTYRNQWAYYAKAVSEPTGIEVYQHGRYVGSAKRNLKNFTTNIASNPKTITCPGHGLAAGDRVTFISNDPAYPSDLDVRDTSGLVDTPVVGAGWSYSSPYLPSAIVERRVYVAANVSTNTFEVKEFSLDSATLNLGSNATGTPSVECGWSYDVPFTGGTWDVTWTSHTKFDDWIWLLEVSANDMPNTNAVTNYTIPNNLLLLKQLIEVNPRFLIVCPTSGSFTDRGPGSVNWNNYYNTYMPWVKTNFPDSYIDTMALFDAQRTALEKSFLTNPAVPEKLWIPTNAAGGRPGTQSTWLVSKTSTAGTRESWVGPGYTPLQLRTSFDDDIHPGNAGNLVIANAVAAKITAKGW